MIELAVLLNSMTIRPSEPYVLRGGTEMGTCFVMQPFDKDVYDKRYEDVFEPAIRKAGLEPYRVDRDPGASVPIDDIESGIKSAFMCFAEITTDNPNVWFELGYAIAMSREVVLVCSEERKSHFPFDIQHRNVIKYRSGAPQDFDELKTKITDRVRALVRKQENIGQVGAISPVKDVQGLSSHETVALVTVMQNNFISGPYVSAWTIKRDMNGAGFTDIAVSIAMKLLVDKAFVEMQNLEDHDGIWYKGYAMTARGEEWLLSNQGQLVLRQKSAEPEDDLPF